MPTGPIEIKVVPAKKFRFNPVSMESLDKETSFNVLVSGLLPYDKEG